MRRPSRTRARRAVAVLVVLGAVAVLAACSSPGQPEGPVERWLRAVSRGTDLAQVEELGSLDAAQVVVDGPLCPVADRPDPAVDECATAQDHLDAFQVAKISEEGGSSTADVPVEVTRKDHDEPVRLLLHTEIRNGTWYVTSAEPLTGDVLFPSEGGQGFGPDVGTVAFLTLLTMVIAFVLSVGVIRLFAGERPVEEERSLEA